MDNIWFLVGLLAGFAAWNMGYISGKIYGKEKAAYEILQFLAWMEPVDRLEWKIKMRAYAEFLLTKANQDTTGSDI